MSEPAYSTYPLTMVHPAFQPSEAVPVPGSQTYDAMGRVVRQDYRGTQQRFPPVTVANEQEEEYYEAQGYQRAGRVDPAAWVRAHAAAPPEDYKPLKYPMWRDGVLYKTAQDDPEASEEDLAPPPAPAAAEPAQPIAAPAAEAANLRAMVEQMNQTMQAMAEQMAQQRAEAEQHAAENAELKAMLEHATAPAAEPEPAKASEVEPDTAEDPAEAAADADDAPAKTGRRKTAETPDAG